MADIDITFSSLSQPGNTFVGVGGSISQHGFTLTSGASAFDVWEASSPSLPSLNPADTSLFEFDAGVTTTLTDGGKPFNLDSIDLAPLITGGSASFNVAFIGTHPDLSTVSQTFTVNDTDLLQTSTFSHFTNVVSVTFTQGTNIGFFGAQDTAYQFDHLMVNSAVPEPNFLGAIGGIFALLGPALLWRRRASMRQDRPAE